MKATNKKIDSRCTQIRHIPMIGVSVLLLLLFVGSKESMGFETLTKADNDFMLSALSPNVRIIRRAPANFTPDDEIEINVMEQTLWIERAIQDDDAGLLKMMSSTLKEWKNDEEYARNWNLESTGIYFAPDRDHKKRFIEKNLLKYVDKRLAGEVRKSEEGSTLATVGRVQRALTPNAEVGQGPVKVKFRARVVSGEGRIVLVNPWLDCTTFLDYKGNINTTMSKTIHSIGLHTSIYYDVVERSWDMLVTKKITNSIDARITSSQSDQQMVFSGDSDKQVAILYHLIF